MGALPRTVGHAALGRSEHRLGHARDLSFILPILSVWIATPLVRRDLRHGKVQGGDATLPSWLPRGTFLRSVVFGLLGLVVVAPLAVLAFHLAGVTQVAMPGFIWVKALYAAALGAALAPGIAITAIATTPVA